MAVLDNLEPQVHRSGAWPLYANARAQYVRGDVRDRAVLEPLVLASDAVVHFGAAVSVGQSMYQVDRYVEDRLRRLLLQRAGARLRPGRAAGWRRPFFEALGLYRLRGTIHYPEAASCGDLNDHR